MKILQFVVLSSWFLVGSALAVTPVKNALFQGTATFEAGSAFENLPLLGSLVLEGSTVNSFEATLSVTDPTADWEVEIDGNALTAKRKITLPDINLTFTTASAGLLDDADVSTMRSTLGLAIGSNVQAWDTDLDTWATKTPTTLGGNLVTVTNPGAVSWLRVNADNTVTARTAAQVRSDLRLETITITGETPWSEMVDRKCLYFGNGDTIIIDSQTVGTTVTNLGDDILWIVPIAGTGEVQIDHGETVTFEAMPLGGGEFEVAAIIRESLKVDALKQATSVGKNLVKLSNPSAIRFLRINADNTVTALSDADTRTALGLGSAATTASTAYATAAQGATADAAIPAPASPANDDVLQRKAGAWVNRTLAQLSTDLLASGILSKSIYAFKELNISNYAWSVTNVGSGGRFSVNEVSIYTGVTTGSSSHLRSSNVFGWMGTPGTSIYYINWTKPKRFLVELSLGRTDANTVAYINIGEPNSDTTVGDLAAKSVGFRVDSNALKVAVHNGSSLTVSSSLATLTTGSSSVVYVAELQLDGAGGWECFLNGTSVGSGTGAPTGDSTQYHTGISFAVTNGAGTSNCALAITRFAKFENY